MDFPFNNKILANVTVKYPSCEQNVHCIFSRTILNDKDDTYISRKNVKTNSLDYDSGIYIDDCFNDVSEFRTHIYFDENGVVIPDSFMKRYSEVTSNENEEFEQSVTGKVEIENTLNTVNFNLTPDEKRDLQINTNPDCVVEKYIHRTKDDFLDSQIITKEQNNHNDCVVSTKQLHSSFSPEKIVEENFANNDCNNGVNYDRNEHLESDIKVENGSPEIKKLKQSSNVKLINQFSFLVQRDLTSPNDNLIDGNADGTERKNDNVENECECRNNNLHFSKNENSIDTENKFGYNSILKCLKNDVHEPNVDLLYEIDSGSSASEEICDSKKDDLLSSLIDMLGCIYLPQLSNEDNSKNELQMLDVKYKKSKILRSNKGLTFQVHHLIRDKTKNLEGTEQINMTNEEKHDIESINGQNAITELSDVGEDSLNLHFELSTITNNKYRNGVDNKGKYAENETDEGIVNVETENDSAIESCEVKENDNNIHFENDNTIIERKRNKKQKKNGKKKRKELNARDVKVHKRYWSKRYSLFSKFDDGILLDDESFYSVTPEHVAAYIAERCRCDLIVDGFCGAGGNAIQFAFTCERVIAIDIDPEKIKLAINNAKVYGVDDRIEFIVGDFFQIIPTVKCVDVIFLAPPWGGPDYMNEKIFSLDAIFPKLGGGKRVYEISRRVAENVAYCLPRNTNIDEILNLATNDDIIEIDQNILNRKLLNITVFSGTLVQHDSRENTN